MNEELIERLRLIAHKHETASTFHSNPDLIQECQDEAETIREAIRRLSHQSSAQPMEAIEIILAGIDAVETDSEYGWWETSFGAAFGAEKLRQIRALFAHHEAKTCVWRYDHKTGLAATTCEHTIRAYPSAPPKYCRECAAPVKWEKSDV